MSYARSSGFLVVLWSVAAVGCSDSAGPGGQQAPSIVGSGAGAGAGAGGVVGPAAAGVSGASGMSTPLAGSSAGAGGGGGAGLSAGTGGASGSAAGAGAGAGGSAGAGGAAGSAGGGGTAGGAEPPSCPATSVLEPGDTNGTISVGGMNRSYIVHVPSSYTGDTAVPLVVDWHPLLTNASFQRTNSGYAQVADREGFIVVYPNGIDNAWNIGPCCTFSRTVDDLGLARMLVDKIKSEACIDPKRVYAAGFSMGGGMSHFLGCNAADVFAAVAPAAFDLLEEDEEPCHPSRPISVLSFRGTADFVVPYSGGASTPPNGVPVTIHFLGAVGTFEKWAELNQCTGSPMAGSSGCQTYSACAEGVEVTLCTRQGGGHETGDPEVGWEMMKRHPMP